MATADSVKAKIQSIITKANSKTGRTDTNVTSAVNALVGGYNPNGITPFGTINITANGTHDVTNYASAQVDVQTGFTPTGTKTITANGEYDVTEFAKASVNVPATGITPSGSINITANGTHDVTNYASALVNVTGLNARIFTATVAADGTSGSQTIAPANDFIASIRNNSNAFVFVRYLGIKASTAMATFWFVANFPFAYGGGSGTTAYNALFARQSTTYQNAVFNTRGLTGENYSGHLCVASNGRLYCHADANYPLRAGQYQIIAGTLDML